MQKQKEDIAKKGYKNEKGGTKEESFCCIFTQQGVLAKM